MEYCIITFKATIIRQVYIAVADLGEDPGVQRNPPFCQDVKN